MRKINVVLRLLMLAAIASFARQSPAQVAHTDWQTELKQQLPLLGHRNWILIVDSAYPLQISPGIETIETNSTQLAVVSDVLKALDHTTHITPIAYLDAELPYVPAQNFAGIDAYREGLKKNLHGIPTQSLPHEQILHLISEAGKTYKVLVLKTNMTMPYTSVFLQLDCKYWGQEGEQKLRQAMKAAGSTQE
jgi:hypothetical protein